MKNIIKGLLLFLVVLMLITACSSSPTPFVLGEEVVPPYGCLEYKLRGGEC